MSRELLVLVFCDEKALQHPPEIEQILLPGRLQRRVKKLLAELDYRWDYTDVGDPARLNPRRDQRHSCVVRRKL